MCRQSLLPIWATLWKMRLLSSLIFITNKILRSQEILIWLEWVGDVRVQEIQQNQHSMQSTSPQNKISFSIQGKTSCPFNKTPRFPPTTSNCPEAFYSQRTQLSHRNTSLGYGNKIDFSKLLPNTPASNRYRIKSSFDIQKGMSFGCAREQSPDRSYLIPQIHRNPGVGQYENQVQTRMSQEYSLHSKTIDVNEKAQTSRLTPGPGTYQITDSDMDRNKHSLSKYSDSKGGTIQPHCRRFPDIRQSPGPTSYTQEDGDLRNGHYTLSRHTGKGGRVFNKQARFTGKYWRASGNPGPSNYNVPTEFGQTSVDFHNF